MNVQQAGSGVGDPEARVAAIVLAGGRATRLGQPKPLAVVGGERLLTSTLNALTGIRTVVVGPAELQGLLAGWPLASLTRESPAFGGPVPGIAAGVARIDAAVDAAPPEWLIVLACDLPRASGIVAALLGALPALLDEEAGACLEADGHPQWLCGIYRADALRNSIAGLRASGSLESAAARTLLGPLAARRIPDVDGLSADIDTPADLFAANRISGSRTFRAFDSAPREPSQTKAVADHEEAGDRHGGSGEKRIQ